MKIIPIIHLLLTLLPLTSICSSSTGGEILIFLYFSAVSGALFVYLIPAYVAMWRDIEKKAGPIIINIFLGWSVIGWVVSLVWAFIGNKKGELIKVQVVKE